jgi:hypothetical protein
MTSKQKVALIAAQYAARAREMTRQGDSILQMAKLLDENGASEVFEELQRSGLVDSEGLLLDGARIENTSFGKAGVS